MKIDGKEITTLLIKIFSKKEYRDDFIKGNIFMNLSGYFNKIENNTYRGDKLDGKIICYNQTVQINDFKFKTDYVQGFVGDDKVPIFCTTLLSDKILEKRNNKYYFKECVKNNLINFGDFAVIFLYKELEDNLLEYAQSMNIPFASHLIRYTNLNNKNNAHFDLYRKKDPFTKFFIKDNFYKSQNEVRFLFPIIMAQEKPVVAKIRPLNFHKEFDTNELFNSSIELSICLKN
mgnify:CR=1 FL=1